MAPTLKMIRLDRLNLPEPSTRWFASRTQDALTESVGEIGIVNPLLVRHLGDGEYAVVAGERRLAAVRAHGAGPGHEVPCVVLDLDDRQAMLVALTDNVVRESLSAYDEARLAQMLVRDYGHEQTAVARALGKSDTWVSVRMAVFGLVPAVLDALRQGTITMDHARALLALRDDPDAQRELLGEVIADGHDAVWLAAQIALRAKGERAIPQETVDVQNAGTMTARTTRKGRIKVVLEAEDKAGLRKLLTAARKHYLS